MTLVDSGVQLALTLTIGFVAIFKVIGGSLEVDGDDAAEGEFVGDDPEFVFESCVIGIDPSPGGPRIKFPEKCTRLERYLG